MSDLWPEDLRQLVYPFFLLKTRIDTLQKLVKIPNGYASAA